MHVVCIMLPIEDILGYIAYHIIYSQWLTLYYIGLYYTTGACGSYYCLIIKVMT